MALRNGADGGPRAGPHLAAVNILGTMVHLVRLDDVLGLIRHTIQQNERATIGYANVQAVNLAYRLPWFRAALNASQVVFCDGFGVKWGARILGHHVPERFTPPDWIHALAEMGAAEGYRFFFLGARPGVAEKAAQKLRAAVPGMQIVGVQHGHFDKTTDGPANQAVVQAINAARPHVLIIGFGMPLQEQWLLENWPQLQANVALPVGAMFDYVAGEVRRGPRWMTDHGLEWLSRLVIEPRRLWQRYLVGNPIFFVRVVRQRFGHGRGAP